MPGKEVWEITVVRYDRPERDRLLSEGWEPYSVTEGRQNWFVHLRRRNVHPEPA